MSDAIKFQIAVGVTHGGGWCVADSGDSVPLNIEHAIDRVWEDISGDSSFGDGYEIYVIDIELPRPVRHAPPQAKPSAVTPAIRVDSKDAILRGRSEALEMVLKTCALDESAAVKVRELLGAVDDDWKDPCQELADTLTDKQKRRLLRLAEVKHLPWGHAPAVYSKLRSLGLVRPRSADRGNHAELTQLGEAVVQLLRGETLHG